MESKEKIEYLNKRIIKNNRYNNLVASLGITLIILDILIEESLWNSSMNNIFIFVGITLLTLFIVLTLRNRQLIKKRNELL